MPTRIVTSTYRYKRPPRKRKAVPLEGPAIVTKRRLLPDAGTQAVAPPRPAIIGRLSRHLFRRPGRGQRIVMAASKRGRRPKPEPEINPEGEARVKAFLARMMRPPRLADVQAEKAVNALLVLMVFGIWFVMNHLNLFVQSS